MANVEVVRLYFQFLLSGSHCALSDSQDVSVPGFVCVPGSVLGMRMCENVYTSVCEDVVCVHVCTCVWLIT